MSSATRAASSRRAPSTKTRPVRVDADRNRLLGLLRDRRVVVRRVREVEAPRLGEHRGQHEEHDQQERRCRPSRPSGSPGRALPVVPPRPPPPHRGRRSAPPYADGVSPWIRSRPPLRRFAIAMKPKSRMQVVPASGSTVSGRRHGGAERTTQPKMPSPNCSLSRRISFKLRIESFRLKEALLAYRGVLAEVLLDLPEGVVHLDEGAVRRGLLGDHENGLFRPILELRLQVGLELGGDPVAVDLDLVGEDAARLVDADGDRLLPARSRPPPPGPSAGSRS